jgi:aldehyde dehydrogenase (NAD+)
MFEGYNYINGSWEPITNASFISFNPRNEQQLGNFPRSSDAEIKDAVKAAKLSQKSWCQLSRIQRGEYLDKLCSIIKNKSNYLAKAITEETGKNINESIAEVNELLHMTQYSFGRSRMPIGEIIPSEITEKDSYIIRKPKGVVAVITPWNFPAAIFFWCAAPALVEGNTIVWKPSEETPMIAQLVMQMYAEAGFPPGVINLIHGDGHVGSELVYNKDVRHYCFTGSYKVGQFIRQICATQHNKTCSLEMGSKSAVIVCADANMDMAVKACVASAYKLSGQRCVSAGRILIEHQIFDEFAKRFVEESWKVELGPLINRQQLEKVAEYNRLATTNEYTQVLLPSCHLGSGNFISPHVYTTKWNVPETRKFLIEEVFGPHVALIPFDDLDEAISIYNDTNFGLSCAVMTNDYRKMRRVRDECDFGLGYVNLPCIGAESSLPFGGIKDSGYGGSSAAGTFDNVVNKVTWTVNHGEEIRMAQGLQV